MKSKIWPLIIGFTIISFLLIGIGIMAYNDIEVISKQVEDIYNHPYTVGKAVREIETDIIAIRLNMRNIVLSPTEAEIQKAVADNKRRRARIESNFALVKERFLGDSALIEEAEETFFARQTNRNQVLELLRAGKTAEAAAITQGESEEAIKEILAKIEAMRVFANNKGEEFRLNAENLHHTFIARILFLIFLAVAIASAIAFFAIRSSYKHFKDMELAQREIEDDAWVKSSFFELMDIMLKEQEIQKMTDSILQFMAEKSGAQVGVFYLAEEDENFTMVSTYAYSDRKNLFNKIKLGEGLVGQAALERKNIILSNVPEDFFSIQSGVGEIKPGSVAAIPLVLDNNIKGVFELAKFDDFNQNARELIDLVPRNIALAIDTLQNSQRTKVLLAESQEMTERLQTQQEELRTVNEELEEHAKILQESEEELKSQSEELQATNEELEEKNKAIDEQSANLQRKNDALTKAQVEIEAKARDLEIASKYKSEFLANMSHELRTPLNSILMLSQLLADTKKSHLPEKELNFAKTIFSDGKELLQLINEILDLSKVEAGKMDLHVTSVYLDDITQSLQMSYSTTAERKNLDFRIEIAAGVPNLWKTDEQRLRQVLRNLLSNAFKFTEEGEVVVSFSMAKDASFKNQALAGKEIIACEVRDSGIGIPEEKQAIIFEAFQQADGSTSRKYGGTGLGLSISRELAKLLGGELQMTSVPEQGSTFTLLLPTEVTPGNQEKDEQEPLPPTLAAPTAATKPSIKPEIDVEKQAYVDDDRKAISPEDKTLLIIEDDPSFATILRDLGNERGFKVVVAEDGHTGLHYADYFKPSGIILDIKLPDISGLEVLESLKDDEITRHIPVHMMSAHDEPHKDSHKAAIGFLKKPASVESVNAAFSSIDNILSKPVKNLLVAIKDRQEGNKIIEFIGNSDVVSTLTLSSEKALQELRSGKYDAAVIDYTLSQTGERSIFEEIRRDSSLDDVRVIALAGEDQHSEELLAIQAYVDSVVTKDQETLEHLLDETALFLHRVGKNLSDDKRKILKKMHNRDAILEGKKVLVVDDDIRNVFAITATLENYNIEVIDASNGLEAIELVKKNSSIDLVLMDIMMPELDGYQAIRRIRKMNHLRDLPIIALTAKAMKGDKDKCLEAGANDYLSKPADNDRLISLLRVWLYR